MEISSKWLQYVSGVAENRVEFLGGFSLEIVGVRHAQMMDIHFVGLDQPPDAYTGESGTVCVCRLEAELLTELRFGESVYDL